MRRLFLALVLTVPGCGDDTDAGMGQDDSSTDTGSSTSDAMTSAPTTMSTSGAATSDDGEDTSTSSDDAVDSTSAEDSTSAPPGDCAFAPAVAEAIEGSTREPIDCGALTLDDDVSLWQEARDCARDATLDQLSFQVLWQYDDGGTVRDAAFASEVGRIYAIYRFDDDAAEGTTSITRTSCTGISTPNRCTVTPGDICIDCIRPSDPAELCD